MTNTTSAITMYIHTWAIYIWDLNLLKTSYILESKIELITTSRKLAVYNVIKIKVHGQLVMNMQKPNPLIFSMNYYLFSSSSLKCISFLHALDYT